MRNAVTLQEAKAHLRVETTDQDSTITIYIGAASRAVENCTGLDLTVDFAGDLYSSPPAEDPIPDPLKQSALLMIGHWFANREAVVVGSTPTEMPMASQWLLQPYRKPGTFFAVSDE